MIVSLQRKFILISAISIFVVFSGIFLVLVFFSNRQLDRTMDTLADAISFNDGVFPEFDPAQPSQPFPYDNIITEETRFSTRFFTVWVDGDGRITHINIDSVSSISEEQVEDFAQTALSEGTRRGWVSDYRYRVVETDTGSTLVFVNGTMNRSMSSRLLLTAPDILLLDEPTNHLDAQSVQWLEDYLHTFPGTVIAVTHDRYFLDNVAGWILELDRGRGIPWKGNYSSWLEQKEKRLAQEEKVETERQKTLAHELEWIRMSPKGRHAKSKARINAYEAMLSHESARRAKDLQIYIPPGPRLGKTVITLENVTKGMGDKLLIENLNAIIPAGAIVGIIGPNGAGKTTLFRMLVGEEKPDAGKVIVGDTVSFAYVDQSRASLTPGKTVYELISEGRDTISLGNIEVNARAYCSRFNFSGSDQQKKVDVLSGGERSRLHLARMLKSGANVLLLDEPTNDIDVNTMRALEDALENFAGTVLVISHDRWFLDRIATHILAFENDSQIDFFDGNYTEYEEDLKKRLGKDAAQPHRAKFRKFTR